MIHVIGCWLTALHPNACKHPAYAVTCKCCVSFDCTLQAQGDKQTSSTDTRSALVQLLVSHGADVQAQDQKVCASALAP